MVFVISQGDGAIFLIGTCELDLDEGFSRKILVPDSFRMLHFVNEISLFECQLINNITELIFLNEECDLAKTSLTERPLWQPAVIVPIFDVGVGQE